MNDNRQGAIESFLDIGFAWNPAERYQDVDELIERLQRFKSAGNVRVILSAKDRAVEAGRILIERDKPTQLKMYNEAMMPTWTKLHQTILEAHAVLAPFKISRSGNRIELPSLPDGFETISMNPPMQFMLSLNDTMVRGIQFLAISNGPRCRIVRTTFVPAPMGTRAQRVGQVSVNPEGRAVPWETTCEYAGANPPAPELILEDMDRCISLLIDDVLQERGLM